MKHNTRCMRIDLSCDLGEASTREEQAVEDALWPMIHSANVACGGHAGDAKTMQHAVERAIRFGVALGAHPSYPDRPNFGRRTMAIAPDELRRSLVSQLRALQEIANERDLGLGRIKAHGALYNEAHHDRALAQVLVEAAMEVSEAISIVAADQSEMARVARERGLQVIREAFADRRYRPDGSLTPRSEPDALLTVDEAAEQAVQLATTGKAVGSHGRPIEIPFDTICIHGDMPGAVARLQRIRSELIAAHLPI
jgi:5-oxoprolinase (ATP-hydrolysing) subunit A